MSSGCSQLAALVSLFDSGFAAADDSLLLSDFDEDEEDDDELLA